MDSGNSGSIQSSSGGDEEYDSRQESISALLESSNHINSIYNRPPPPPNPSSSIFDSLSNFLDPFPRLPSPSPPANANSLLNLDVQWTRGSGGPIASSSPAYTSPRVSPYGSNGSTRMSPSMQLPRSADLPTTSARTNTPSSVSNSKKRSRASRLAPTTVLNTNTSNFRAMVQEFTGIPAPPFSSAFNRSSLDLFATAAAPPPYLLRPFAQKVQPSFANTLATTTTTTSAASGNTSNFSSAITPNSNSFQHLSSGLTLSKQYQNLLNINNSLLPFQSLLQPPATPKYPPFDNFPASIPLKSQVPSTISSSDSHLKIGFFDELSVNHGHVSNTISSSLHNPPPSWSGAAASNNGTGNCKMKHTQGSADFHADKEQENVSLRGEGMLDSWICSSD